MKQDFKPGTLIYPLPAVLVSCGSSPEEWNLITVGWTGTVCTDPPMCYISLRPERYSHGIILRNMEFVINLTTSAMARQTDWCGVRSGRSQDKFKATGLTPAKALKVSCPIIQESPVSIECRVREVMSLGSHDMFLSDVVNVRVDSDLLDSRSGLFDLRKADPLVYVHGQYFHLGELIGKFGFSVQKKGNQGRQT